MTVRYKKATQFSLHLKTRSVAKYLTQRDGISLSELVRRGIHAYSVASSPVSPVTDPYKTPTQVYLDPETRSVAEHLTQRDGISLSELARRAIEAYFFETTPPEKDPTLQVLEKIIGLGSSGPSDEAEHHDYYLMKWEWEQSHPGETFPDAHPDDAGP